jgi:hypothetical protein
MLSEKKRGDPLSQNRRRRAAQIGGRARRKQFGYTAESGIWKRPSKDSHEQRSVEAPKQGDDVFDVHVVRGEDPGHGEDSNG